MANETSARGPSDPDSSQQRLVFSLTLTQEPFDYLLSKYGLLPTEDLRLTVAMELHNQATNWVDEVVQQTCDRLLSHN